MKMAIVLGSESEIAAGLIDHLVAEEWRVRGWKRGEQLPAVNWDLIISCLGTVAPVGMWYDLDDFEFQRGIESNLLLPIRLLRSLWAWRNPEASVCFLAGSNPNMIMAGYCAYNTGKMALLKAVEQMDFESPYTKIFALGPGTILTKIHDPSKVWENPKLAAAIETGEDRVAKIARVYACLKWAIAQDKAVVGGRNLCVSDPWDVPETADHLNLEPDMWKLRRYE